MRGKFNKKNERVYCFAFRHRVQVHNDRRVRGLQQLHGGSQRDRRVRPVGSPSTMCRPVDVRVRFSASGHQTSDWLFYQRVLSVSLLTERAR